MATKDTATDLDIEDEELDDEVDEEVDAQEEQDETDSTEDDASGHDDGETDDESDDSDEEDESDDEGFQKRFTQFKGDTPDEYLKNLEEGYAKSSTEGVRLSRQVKDLNTTVERVNQLIADNPDLAAKLQAGTGDTEIAPTQPKDPALAWAQSEMTRTWEKEYRSFANDHPEIETDPTLADALDTKLKAVREVIMQTENRLVSMGEGLDMAWKLLGKDNSQENLSVAAKNTAGQSKSKGTKKGDAPKPKFSEAQISVAMDMMNVDRTTAIKKLSEHVK